MRWRWTHPRPTAFAQLLIIWTWPLVHFFVLVDTATAVAVGVMSPQMWGNAAQSVMASARLPRTALLPLLALSALTKISDWNVCAYSSILVVLSRQTDDFSVFWALALVLTYPSILLAVDEQRVCPVISTLPTPKANTYPFTDVFIEAITKNTVILIDILILLYSFIPLNYHLSDYLKKL